MHLCPLCPLNQLTVDLIFCVCLDHDHSPFLTENRGHRSRSVVMGWVTKDCDAVGLTSMLDRGQCACLVAEVDLASISEPCCRLQTRRHRIILNGLRRCIGPLKLIGRCHPAPPADDRSYRTRPCPSTGHGGRPSPDWRTRRRPTGPRRTDGRADGQSSGPVARHLPSPDICHFPSNYCSPKPLFYLL